MSASQVTQAEYQDIARTFSDVRTGRGDMMMTTAGRQQVNSMSNNVLVDDAGNARLDSSGNEQHHSTTIRAVYNGAQTPTDPLDNPMDQNRDGVVDANDNYSVANRMNSNAFADSVGGLNRNDWFRPTNPDGTTSTTRGAGTNTEIWWNPGVSVVGARDVIMAHEMNHAYHETQGTMADGTGASENTYREQRNQLGLGEMHLPRMAYNAGVPGQGANQAATDAAWGTYHTTNPNAF